MRLIKLWIRQGHKVIIFTARAADPKNIPAIEKWLKEHGLSGLKVTHEKTPEIGIIIDDKAVGVEKNTGKLDKPIVLKEASSTPGEGDDSSENWLTCEHEKCACIEDIPNYAERVDKVDPSVVDWMNKFSLVPRENSFHPANILLPEEWTRFKENYGNRIAPNLLSSNNSADSKDACSCLREQEANREHEKSAKFNKPENYDPVKDLSTKGYTLFTGCNDWESITTWIWVTFNGVNEDSRKRVYLELDPPQDLLDAPHWNGEYGRAVCRRWIRLARESAAGRAKEYGIDNSKLRADDFLSAAKKMEDAVKAYGLEKATWEEVSIKEAAAVPGINVPTTHPQQEIDQAQSDTSEGATIPTTPQTPPRTGPGAIYEALKNIDLDAKEAEAKDILHRHLKSKRDGAVKVLGIIDGLRRTGIKPHELMISRVPVIPPVFRPFTAAGDVFIPGDANELYRDLINMRAVNKQIGEKFGPGVQQKHALQVYDAMKAVYGFGEPTSPKTKEREISGFLKKVTGASPKWSFLIRKMISKPQDFVGRSVVAVEPSCTR